MTGLVWVSIIGGLAIVALAVGIPYLLTHKRMRSPHDLSEGQEYVQAKRRWRRQQNTAAMQSGQAPEADVRNGQSIADAGDEASRHRW